MRRRGVALLTTVLAAALAARLLAACAAAAGPALPTDAPPHPHVTAPAATPAAAAGATAPAGYPGQSNLVPPGFPTPNSAFERLVPGGPARDPGPLDWARPGRYVAPHWTDFGLNSFTGNDRLATTYYFYWHDLTDPALTVAQVGPGFTNTAYCTGGPARNCFDVGREGGAYYERQLEQALASGRRLLAVETWNECSEGSEIAETLQHGRRYIDLTRAYVDRLKAADTR